MFAAAATFCVILAGAVLCRAAGTVANCTESDLRAALVGGGEITFACDGVLGLSDTVVITNDTFLNAGGHNITLSGGHSVRLLQLNPGVTLELNHITLADGLALGTNSVVGNGSGGDGFGGAVWNNAGTLQATDCIFTNNNALGGTGGPGVSGTIAFNSGGAGVGGAIYNDLGELCLTNVLFIGNVAQGGQGGPAPSPAPSKGGNGGPSCGGAVYSRTGLLSIASCRFVNNSAPASVPGPSNGYYPNSGGAVGGALYSISGTNLVLNTRFESQSVGGGRWFCNASAGALYQTAGSLWLGGCTFATNAATGGDGIVIGSGSNAGSADGGAVLLAYISAGQQGMIHLLCDAVISNTCFVGNLARGGLQGPAVGLAGTARGGAVENSSSLKMLNCTLAANSARGGDITFPSYPLSSAYGGALVNWLGATSVLTHVTIAGNSASKGAGAGGSSAALGGGIYLTSGKVEVQNSVLAPNTPGGNASGTLTDDGANISSDATCGFTAPGSLNSTDPMLAAPAANGGPTLTMALRPGSPAINAANAALSLPTDQRGMPRPQGSSPDIGALEAAVLSLHRRADGNWSVTQGAPFAAVCTLRASTNLVDWSDLQTLAGDENGQVEFVVPDAGIGARYFRSYGIP